MPRFVPVAIALGLLVIPVSAPAAPSATPTATAQADERVRDAGLIDGIVTNVDYSRGTFTVDTKNQGKIDVLVMPTTSVQTSDPGYHTFTDVSKGWRVQIFASRVAGKLVAQIIRIVKR